MSLNVTIEITQDHLAALAAAQLKIDSRDLTLAISADQITGRISTTDDRLSKIRRALDKVQRPSAPAPAPEIIDADQPEPAETIEVDIEVPE